MTEKELVIEWYNVTHTNSWQETVQSKAQTEWALLMDEIMNPETALEKVPNLRAKAAVWSQVIRWQDEYKQAFDIIKEEQAAELKTDQYVGVKASEQWFEAEDPVDES